ncbi:hypothetical protein CROQUDRAFT_526642 [Cronartium quercuum f. sp. fusiforme G11]|uniref:Peptide N-acetyl-beta-D-glucosaminyl asparaginase amidase A N-terminal domain-containing protein n=1 Tax=Cronartium quercuum f. sp. fusiforme G11 TaxID=708437 RepID=A0A9P6TBG6_9BASI|nr:hypothetical protein CROQUDRAFT_526642 [Cronartium quercuum f. sp. fusiforme G11]
MNLLTLFFSRISFILILWFSFSNLLVNSFTIKNHNLAQNRDRLYARQTLVRDEPLKNWQLQPPPSVPNGPSCSYQILSHTFASSYAKDAIVPYYPPSDCGEIGSWAAVIFNLTVTSKGHQYDRLASLFLGETEIWRTSTSEPLPQGIYWSVTRDVTKYMPLLMASSTNLVMRLENILDQSLGLDGAFEVTIVATYYQPTTEFPTPPTPHMIIPFQGGRVHSNDSDTSFLRIPANTASAYVEIFATGGANEEFWYANVDDKAKDMIDPQHKAGITGKGCFREVQLWIDGRLAGVAFPFPVIYTGGLVLTLWRPMTSFGALETPTYNVDITPWLPLLTDDQYHNFTITVEGQGMNNTINSEWVLSANMAVRLDPSGRRTTGRMRYHKTDPYKDATPTVIEGNKVQIETTGKRVLSISSIIQTGSSSPQIVTFEQELSFSNTQIWGTAGSTEVIAQSTSGTSKATYGTQVKFFDQYQWPLNVRLHSSQQGLTGAVDLSYKRQHVDPLTLLLTRTNYAQSAQGNLNKVNGQITGGPAKHSVNLYFGNSRNQEYSRQVSVENNQVLYDQMGGNMI